MLREGNKLLGSHFHFHTFVTDNEQRLGLGILDGFALFIPFMLGQSKEVVKETQGVVVGALCEVLAEEQAKDVGKPISLFQHALKGAWYHPRYDIDRGFLKRHNIKYKED